MRDLRAAVEYIVTWLASRESGAAIGAVGDIHAVGHRVVHGGEQFQRSVRIDDAVLHGIEEMIDLKFIIDIDHMSRTMMDAVLQMARTTSTARSVTPTALGR